MGNAYPHGYCIPSRVLHIVYTGWIQDGNTGGKDGQRRGRVISEVTKSHPKGDDDIEFSVD